MPLTEAGGRMRCLHLWFRSPPDWPRRMCQDRWPSGKEGNPDSFADDVGGLPALAWAAWRNDFGVWNGTSTGHKCADEQKCTSE